MFGVPQGPQEEEEEGMFRVHPVCVLFHKDHDLSSIWVVVVVDGCTRTGFDLLRKISKKYTFVVVAGTGHPLLHILPLLSSLPHARSVCVFSAAAAARWKATTTTLLPYTCLLPL